MIMEDMSALIKTLIFINIVKSALITLFGHPKIQLPNFYKQMCPTIVFGNLLLAQLPFVIQKLHCKIIFKFAIDSHICLKQKFVATVKQQKKTK